MRTAFLATLLSCAAACGSEHHHAAPPPDHAAPAEDAGAPVAAIDAPPPTAPAPDAPDPLAGCEDPDHMTITPPQLAGGKSLVGYRDGAKVVTGAYGYCDLPLYMVLVHEVTKGKPKQTKDSLDSMITGDVVAIARTTGKVVKGKIGAKSSCSDECGGPSGGSAGCSIRSGCNVQTTIPGARQINTELVSGRVFHSVRTITDHGDFGCSPTEGQTVYAICSTASRTIEVQLDLCEGGTSGRLGAIVYEGAAPRTTDEYGEAAPPSRTLTGKVDPSSDASTWRYQFHDDGGDVALTFHLASPAAELAIGGKSEDCLAFALGQ